MGKPLSFGEVIPDFEMTLSMTTHQPMEGIGYWSYGINQEMN